MFSNTRTDCMYSNSAEWARGARVQSPKREKKTEKTPPEKNKHKKNNVFAQNSF